MSDDNMSNDKRIEPIELSVDNEQEAIQKFNEWLQKEEFALLIAFGEGQKVETAVAFNDCSAPRQRVIFTVRRYAHARLKFSCHSIPSNARVVGAIADKRDCRLLVFPKVASFYPKPAGAA